MIKAYQVRISGRVTGVGFRYSTIHKSSIFPNLCGYVRNVGYSEVEAVLQGEENEVKEMLEWLKEGPSSARVDNIVATEIPVDPTRTGFDIR